MNNELRSTTTELETFKVGSTCYFIIVIIVVVLLLSFDYYRLLLSFYVIVVVHCIAILTYTSHSTGQSY